MEIIKGNEMSNREDGILETTLSGHDLANLLMFNDNLAQYCCIFMGSNNSILRCSLALMT